MTTSGFPPPALARGGVALPAGVTFVDNGNGTGTLSGTPAAGTGGTYAITFTATNSVGVERAAGVHADGERPARDHQREHDDVHGGRRRHVHGDRDRQPDAGDLGERCRCRRA